MGAMFFVWYNVCRVSGSMTRCGDDAPSSRGNLPAGGASPVRLRALCIGFVLVGCSLEHGTAPMWTL